jgi:outer membrane protein
LNKSIVVAPLLALAAAVLGHAQAAAPAKVGIIQIQSAILSTKDGQKAMGELQARFGPKKAELEKKQNEITQMQQQYRAGSATMSEEAKAKLARDIDQGTKNLNRDTEDAQAEVEQAENKVWQELGQRMMPLITKYGHDNGYSVIIDISSPQTPVVYFADGTDVTKDIIELYDKSFQAAAAAAAAAAPAAPKPAAAKPPAAPAAKPPAPPAAAAPKK